MDKYKIAIVDDHQLFRDGIDSLLSKQEDFEVVISSENGKDFFKKLKKGVQPDLLLLDLTMPEMNGFEVLVKLKKISKHQGNRYFYA